MSSDQDGKLPISMLARIGKKYNLKQVLVIGYDGEMVHLATWGADKEHCALAARAQDFWQGVIKEFSFKGEYDGK